MKTPVRIVLRLPADLNRQVRRAAKQHQQSINRYTQDALRRWLQNELPPRRGRQS